MIMIMVESHLNEEIKDEELHIPGFKIFRCDRKDREQGGVIIYVRENIEVTETNKFSNGTCEVLSLKLPQLKYNFICLYRPPKTQSEKLSEALKQIDDCIKKCSSDEKVVFVGDMNFPFIEWKTVDDVVYPVITSGDTIDSQNQAKSMIELTDRFFMQQVISEPTRENNILDLMFSTHSDEITNISIEKVSNVLSDHNFVYFNIPGVDNTNKTVKKAHTHIIQNDLSDFQFWSEKCNWVKVKKHLQNTDWSSIIDCSTDIDSDLENLYKSVYEACSQNIPVKRTAKEKVIPKDREILMRKRKLLRRKLNSTDNKKIKDKTNLKIVNLEVQLMRSHENERLRNEAKIILNTKRNTKAFYKYSKQFTKQKSTIGPLLNKHGVKTDSPEEMCEILKTQYEKAFNKTHADMEIKIHQVNEIDKDKEIHINEFFSDESPFNQIDITITDILSAVNETKLNSAPGPDNFPPILLHKCKEELAAPLRSIMKKSLATSNVPQKWKTANITCIHKGGDKSLPINYRPVSLTSILAKLLERILRWYMILYLEVNNAFPESQHGFRSGRSTVSQLLEHYESIIEALERKSNIDIIMLDYSKAFDKINISILLQKLKKLGVGGEVGRWIGNFLIGRKQLVSVNRKLSEPSEISSGVPQGTILAPLLFLVYISDIGDNVTHSNLTSYADDSKTSKIVKNQGDVHHLQCDLNKLSTWTADNLMTFNVDKFEVLRIGKDEQLKKETKYTTPDGADLPEKSRVKDLGVIFNNSGDFHDHIETKVAKAKSIAGLILRTFLTRDPVPLMMLFKTLVIPILDYGSIIWSPYTKCEINKIEAVQRTFTSKLEGLEDLNYHQRLQKLQTYSLERRRERYDLLYSVKILKRAVPNIGLKFKWSDRRGRTLVPPPVAKNSSEHSKTLRNNSYRSRASRLFNALPAEIRNVPVDITMTRIKSMLDRYLNTIRDEPQLPGYTLTAASNSVVHQRRFEDSPFRMARVE